MTASIENTPASGLCLGCGICSAICPTGALQMRRDKSGEPRPTVDAGRCNGCGACADICPGINAAGHGPVHDPADGPLRNGLGPVRASVRGRAVDNSIHAAGAGGGVITAALCHALRSGLLTGAVVTRMHPARPMETQTFVARTPEEILQAAGSKYAPACFDEAMKEVMAADGRYAIVGLPCHVLALRRAAARHPDLARRISLVFGLVCGHGVRRDYTRYLLRRSGISPESVRAIQYRDKSVAGAAYSYRFTHADAAGTARSIRLPFETSDVSLAWSGMLFAPRRCLFCGDFAAESADLSVGDYWPSRAATGEYSSVILARTPRGQEFLDLLTAAGVLTVSSLSVDEARHLYRRELKTKKEHLRGRIRAARFIGWETPAGMPDDRRSSLWNAWHGLKTLAEVSAAEKFARWAPPALLLRGFLSPLSCARHLLRSWRRS